MHLIPHPNGTHTVAGGTLTLARLLVVQCSPQAAGAVSVLGSRLAAHCGAGVQIATPGATAQGTALQVQQKTAGRPGWYSLAVTPGGIQAVYGDEEGLHCAMATLYHLLRAAYKGDGALACQTLEDWPKYRHRAQHIDTARHFFTTEQIKRVIEQLSLLKMNVLHWHIADDQAWRMESLAYPLLTERCGSQYHTWEDIRDIVAYAAARGVTILPEFEIPGHSSAAIASYPALSCQGKQIEPPTTGGIFPVILCGGKPEAYTFIEAILGEICDLFPGETIHIGGDEAPKSEWEKCPYCAAKIKAEGLAGPEDLQGHMLNFANAVLKRHGRRAICWNECLMAQNLDEDIAVQYWREGGKESYSLPGVNDGRTVVFSNFSPLYFDYPAALWNLQKVYAYTPNLRGQAPGDGANVLGIESCLWAEFIETPQRQEHMLFPRAVATAEVAWSETRDYARFRESLAAYYEVFAEYGVNAAPLAEAEVHGPKKGLQAAGYILGMVGKLRGMVRATKEMRRSVE